MDPRKAGIVVLVIYAGVLAWVLPPLERFGWSSPEEAEETGGDAATTTQVAAAEPAVARPERAPERAREARARRPEPESETPATEPTQRAPRRKGGPAPGGADGAPQKGAPQEGAPRKGAPNKGAAVAKGGTDAGRKPAVAKGDTEAGRKPQEPAPAAAQEDAGPRKRRARATDKAPALAHLVLAGLEASEVPGDVRVRLAPLPAAPKVLEAVRAWAADRADLAAALSEDGLSLGGEAPLELEVPVGFRFLLAVEGAEGARDERRLAPFADGERRELEFPELVKSQGPQQELELARAEPGAGVAAASLLDEPPDDPGASPPGESAAAASEPAVPEPAVPEPAVAVESAAALPDSTVAPGEAAVTPAGLSPPSLARETDGEPASQSEEQPPLVTPVAPTAAASRAAEEAATDGAREQRVAFFGRVLAAESGEPLSGVEIRRGGRRVSTSDASGLFHVALRTADGALLGLEVDGYDALSFETQGDHSAPERAQVLELEPRLESAPTLPPPPAPLAPSLPDVTSKKGESASEGLVGGKVIDQGGFPVASTEIWLVSPWSEADRQPRLLESHDRVFARSRTGADGAFRLEGVPAGHWLLGVAPHDRREDREVSSIASPIEVLPGPRSTGALLEVGRGLEISGVLRDSGGDPIARAAVAVAEEGIAGRLWGRTSMDGTFRLGPLGPRSCRLSVLRGVERGEQTFGPFEPGSVVSLVLQPGRVVAGSVRDSSGAPVRAELHAVRSSDAGSLPSDRVGTFEGDYRITGLERRVYRIVATTDDGRLGWSREVDLTVSGSEEGLGIQVGPGAHVVLEGDPQSDIRLIVEGSVGVLRVLGAEEAWSGPVVVPAGAVTLLAVDPRGRVLARESLQLSEGSTHEVHLRLDG